MLSRDWIIENPIDFEYKKYILLDFLQKIDKEFEQGNLYPYFSYLSNQYTNLNNLKNEKDNYYLISKGKPIGFDFNNLKIVYDNNREFASDDIREIFEIIKYSIPKISEQIHKGKNIFSEELNSINIETIGIKPPNQQSGIIIIHHKGHFHVFSFKNVIYDSIGLKQINTQKLFQEREEFNLTPEKIKEKTINKWNDINPLAFLCSTNSLRSLTKTVFPIIKYKISKEVLTKNK